MNELKKFPINSKKIKRDRKRKEMEEEVFSSSAVPTMKSKSRNIYKKNSKPSANNYFLLKCITIYEFL